jgi:ferric-dicitrate binding protein FerR (iron transport regulator)
MIIMNMKATNKWIVISASLALLILAVSAGKGESEPVAPVAGQSAPPVIEVVFLEGEVLIDGQEPELGDKLGTSFVVQTGKGARCDIVFNSGNSLSIGQNALADFDFTNQVANVRMERGGLSSVLKKLVQLGDTDSFSVQTATAIAGVRGTSFCVWVDDTSSYICACNGSVRTIDATGSNDELLEASHHTARLYSKTGSTISKETAAMLHHTDELLQSVASRIGYVIDWNTIDK